MCSSPLASARSVPGSGCRCRYAPGGGRGPPRVDHDVPRARGPARVEVLHGRRHRVGRVRADQQHGLRARRCPRAGTAGRGRRRRPGWPRSPRTTCRTGRCSRSTAERSATRANLPSGYAFSLVSPPPPNAADAVRPVRGLAAPDGVGDDPVERLVPGGFAQRAGPVAGFLADQRGEQPVGVVEQLGRGPALGAQPAAVGREVRCGSSRTRADRRRSASSRTAGSSTGSAYRWPSLSELLRTFVLRRDRRGCTSVR